MSPFLQAIEAKAATLALHSDARAELSAEKACYLARMGDVESAVQILKALRQEFGGSGNSRMGIWIILLEGIILFFRTVDPRSRDRVVRANALSVASAALDLQYLTAAWLAHIDFNRSNFVGMASALRQCVGGVIEVSSPWQMRVCLVIADCYTHCGELASAKQWYERARIAAIELRDDATMSALIYNRAALTLSWLRISSECSPEDLRAVSMQIESAASYQMATGNSSLPSLVASCRCQLLVAEKRFAEARLLYERVLSDDAATLSSISDLAVKRLEYALCLHNLGLEPMAKAAFDAIDPEKCVDMTSDERVVFGSLYRQLSAARGSVISGGAFDMMLEDWLDVYERDSRGLSKILAEIVPLLTRNKAPVGS